MDVVGGFNPLEKYARQIGSFPPVGGENKKHLKPPPRDSLLFEGCPWLYNFYILSPA